MAEDAAILNSTVTDSTNSSISSTDQSPFITSEVVNYTSNSSSPSPSLSQLLLTTIQQDVTNSSYNSSDFLVDFDNKTSLDDYGNASSDINIFTNRTPKEIPFYLDFRDEFWVLPLVTMALINVAAILIFEIYVLYKSCGERRHLFLGQMLLLSLFLCSVVALLQVPEPHWLFCGITRAGVGIVYALLFGTLLVKCVFLLKIHDGIYFNASFQALLMFFIVAVEVVIVIQWLVYEPPDINFEADLYGTVYKVCQKTPVDRIEYLTYDMFLLFLVVVASIRARGLRENNKEAVYIGCSIATSLIFWVAWVSLSLIFGTRYDAPAVAFGLVCTSIMTLCFIFIPKAMVLACPRKRTTNGGSSTLGSHSVLHTPSFLHLQPHSVLPSSNQSTLMKQSNVNADYCRAYSTRIWRYDYPSFHQIESPAISNSDVNSMKKSNGSTGHLSHLY